MNEIIIMVLLNTNEKYYMINKRKEFYGRY